MTVRLRFRAGSHRLRAAIGLRGVRALAAVDSRRLTRRSERRAVSAGKPLHVLLVGPGIMPIPSDGWGAVETVIWQQKVHLERLGHSVDILNRRGVRAALAAKPWTYDLVHLHYDELAQLWGELARRYGFPLAATTHYGYAAWPQRWDPGFARVFARLCDLPAHFALSPEIAERFRIAGSGAWIGVVPNGTEVDEIAFDPTPGNGRALCIGKIEPRKRQADLARLFEDKAVPCDFVGPVVDDRFAAGAISSRYLGSWRRADVHARMTQYSALVLASWGEAHALVVLEAMAAGLSLVLTPQAAANLEPGHPWVHVVDDVSDEFAERVAIACRENASHRAQIREHARRHWGWDTLARRYESAARDMLRAAS